MFKTYKKYKSILFIRSNSVSDFRIEFAMRHLERAGYDVEIISETPFYKVSQFDLFICSRPGNEMVGLLESVLDAHKKLIVDLDDDFNSIPIHNPAYPFIGPGHPTFLRNLGNLLHRPGTLVTYSTAELERRYHKEGIVIPNAWDCENELWNLPKEKHSGINLGWSGTNTHREDFKLVEAGLRRVLHERDDVNLVISNDFELYNKFNDIPNSRTRFIPGLPFKDYPAIFKYIDILLIPLRDTHFNRAKSDIKLVECGASRTFWLASPLPFYESWGVGGRIVNDDVWYENIMYALDNPLHRQTQTGLAYKQAQSRTSEIMGAKWVAIVNELLGMDGDE